MKMARKKIKLSKIPKQNERIFNAEMPCEFKGRRQRWNGTGWVDEGKSDGTEPTLIIPNEGY
jgi:hypothetical protein